MNKVIFDTRPVTPSKIICIGLNYVDHIKELGNDLPQEPVIFIKPNSSIANELYVNPIDSIHYEGEICFIIENSQLAGVGFGLDLTKRELQAQLRAKGLPWEKSKAFNHAAVFSEFVAFKKDTSNLSLKLTINNIAVQLGGVALMVFKPEFLLSDITKSFSLEDGDIIMTGTPKGVGAISQGDTFIGQIFNGEELLIEHHWQAR